MARVITDNAHYADIAAAIRVKLHAEDTYRPAEMAAAILSIEGGWRCPRGEAEGICVIPELAMAWSSSAAEQE